RNPHPSTLPPLPPLRPSDLGGSVLILILNTCSSANSPSPELSPPPELLSLSALSFPPPHATRIKLSIKTKVNSNDHFFQFMLYELSLFYLQIQTSFFIFYYTYLCVHLLTIFKFWLYTHISLVYILVFFHQFYFLKNHICKRLHCL